MLKITIPDTELYDEENEEFIQVKEQTLSLEHSLVSLSKWESKWHKSFIHTEGKTDEEILDYIKFMTLTQNVKPEVYKCFTKKNITEIIDYIDDPMTAVKFSKDKTGKKNNEIVTNELIYCWMIELSIPFECQKWHLNRLIALIRVCQDRRTPPKKMSKSETIKHYAALNEARRRKLKSKG